MKYKLYPIVKQIDYTEEICNLSLLRKVSCSVNLNSTIIGNLPKNMHPVETLGEGYTYTFGENAECGEPQRPQEYCLSINKTGIFLKASDIHGLRYGLDTLRQIVDQSTTNAVNCRSITDYPSVIDRGLLLDISRGKVYTQEYFFALIDLLSKLRYNVLQLYTEHVFEFKKHPKIHEGSSPMTSEDILKIQDYCKTKGIELKTAL